MQENREGQSNTNNLTKEKNRKEIQTYHKRHEDNNEEKLEINNTDANNMECHACGLKGYKIKECQTKQNIYIHCKPKENIKIKTRNTGRNAAIWKYQKL